MCCGRLVHHVVQRRDLRAPRRRPRSPRTESMSTVSSPSAPSAVGLSIEVATMATMASSPYMQDAMADTDHPWPNGVGSTALLPSASPWRVHTRRSVARARTSRAPGGWHHSPPAHTGCPCVPCGFPCARSWWRGAPKRGGAHENTRGLGNGQGMGRRGRRRGGLARYGHRGLIGRLPSSPLATAWHPDATYFQRDAATSGLTIGGSVGTLWEAATWSAAPRGPTGVARRRRQQRP